MTEQNHSIHPVSCLIKRVWILSNGKFKIRILTNWSLNGLDASMVYWMVCYLFTVLWYICRKHVSFVEFVAVMTINASYLLNALACLGLPELKRRSERLLHGSFTVRYFSPNAQEKNHQSISWLKPFLLIRPPCYCDLLVNVSRF